MSLQKTSSDDRSDPTVAPEHLRNLSQDCSSRSSSRTKKGSEAPMGPEPEQLGPLLGAPPRSDKAAARWDGSRFHAPLLRGTER
jgi:hypothetical protein